MFASAARFSTPPVPTTMIRRRTHRSNANITGAVMDKDNGREPGKGKADSSIVPTLPGLHRRYRASDRLRGARRSEDTIDTRLHGGDSGGKRPTLNVQRPTSNAEKSRGRIGDLMHHKRLTILRATDPEDPGRTRALSYMWCCGIFAFGLFGEFFCLCGGLTVVP